MDDHGGIHVVLDPSFVVVERIDVVLRLFGDVDDALKVAVGFVDVRMEFFRIGAILADVDGVLPTQVGSTSASGIPIETGGPLGGCQRVRELGAVAHEVDDLREAKVLYEVVGLRHPINYRAGYHEQHDFLGGFSLILADDSSSTGSGDGGSSCENVFTSYSAISYTASLTFCRVFADTCVSPWIYLEVLDSHLRAEIVDLELADFATFEVGLIAEQHFAHGDTCEGLQLPQPVLNVAETAWLAMYLVSSVRSNTR